MTSVTQSMQTIALLSLMDPVIVHFLRTFRGITGKDHVIVHPLRTFREITGKGHVIVQFLPVHLQRY